MSPAHSFVFVACAVVAICSTASHLAVGWLGIKAEWGGEKYYGSRQHEATAVLYSSSPGYDGIDWDRVSALLGASIESWATPGSSPAEWDAVPARPGPSQIIFAFSAYDLNEYLLCDFRANVVPLSRAIADLPKAEADRTLAKRILDQYAVMSVRKVFPTVGRSDGVMVGVRAALRRMSGQGMDSGDAPRFAAAGRSTITERISQWDDARFRRRLLSLNAANGTPSFDGPKKLALLRILRRHEGRRPISILVLPNSPTYQRRLMPGTTMQAFEAELADLRRLFPSIPMFRLDQLPALASDDHFYDLIHMNRYGQDIATDYLLSRLRESVTATVARQQPTQP